MKAIDLERICRTTDTSDEAIMFRLRSCREATKLSVSDLASSMGLYRKEFEAQERLEPHCRDLARHYHCAFQFPFDFIYGGEYEVIKATLSDAEIKDLELIESEANADDDESNTVSPAHLALREVLSRSDKSLSDEAPTTD
jgi:transcriptional regulator with XRE-family HTH domain